MSEIVLEGVSKHYGTVRAVDQVSLRAEAGKFLVLLGPSGCGKSTVLRLIAGLEEVSAGRVLIGGRDVTRLEPDKRRVSMVFQSYALFPHLCGGGEHRLRPESPPDEGDGKKGEAEQGRGAGRPVASSSRASPRQLSGGQRQRVALARAIVAENAICLMDEPLSNLDAQLRHGMRVEIRALQQRLGMTVVYVTHDQVEAMSMADRIILMREGRIEQEGSPEDLYARPATLFAARFIGTPAMNILALADGPDGAVIRGSRDPVLRGRGAGLAARRPARARFARRDRRRRRGSDQRRVPRRRHDPHRKGGGRVAVPARAGPPAPGRRLAGARRVAAGVGASFRGRQRQAG